MPWKKSCGDATSSSNGQRPSPSTYDTKNAAHCIRLLRMGAEFLETGALQVVRPDAEELLTIKYGGWTLDQVKSEAERLFQRAEEAYARCTLPREPDRERAEQLLVSILREHFANR